MKVLFRSLLAAALLLLLTLALCMGALAARRVLVVGNSDYEQYGYPGLFGAPYRDAELVRDLFTRSEIKEKPVAVKELKDATKSQLLSAITTTFAGATSKDESVFYFSGHGALSYSGIAYLCTMGDESRGTAVWLSMADLKKALDKIPGTKLVLLDSCFSGQALGKSSKVRSVAGQYAKQVSSAFSKAPASASFAKNGYKVLTAANAFEETYLLRDTQASAFTSALASGIGVRLVTQNEEVSIAQSGFPADVNSDGAVTLTELYNYIDRHIVAGDAYSSAQVYPQKDKFVVVSYRKPKSDINLAVSQLNAAPYSASLSKAKPVTFKVSMRREGRVYLAVYRRSAFGQMDTKPYRVIYEGKLRAGTHTFSWNGKDAKGKKREGEYLLTAGLPGDMYGLTGALPVPFVLISRAKKPTFSVKLGASSLDAQGERELAIAVTDVKPYDDMAYDVRIESATGAVKRTLATNDPARARWERKLTNEDFRVVYSNTYYWDGRDNHGRLLPSGTYYVTVSAVGGGYRVAAMRRAVTLKRAGQPKISAYALSRQSLTLSSQKDLSITGKVNKTGTLKVRVINSAGKTVRVLESVRAKTGAFKLKWDGRLENGASAPSGCYTLKAQLITSGALSKTLTKRVRLTGRTVAPPKVSLSSKSINAAGELSVRVSASQAGVVEPFITNSSGKVLATLKPQRLKKGTSALKLNMKKALGTSPASGKYKLKLDFRSAATSLYARSVCVAFSVKAT